MCLLWLSNVLFQLCKWFETNFKFPSNFIRFFDTVRTLKDCVLMPKNTNWSYFSYQSFYISHSVYQEKRKMENGYIFDMSIIRICNFMYVSHMTRKILFIFESILTWFTFVLLGLIMKTWNVLLEVWWTCKRFGTHIANEIFDMMIMDCGLMFVQRPFSQKRFLALFTFITFSFIMNIFFVSFQTTFTTKNLFTQITFQRGTGFLSFLRFFWMLIYQMLLQRMIPLEGFVTNMTMISIITGMKKLLVIFKFQLYGKTFTTQFTLECLDLFVNSFHMAF